MSGPPGIKHPVTTPCPSGKKGYLTRAAARDHARRFAKKGQGNMRPYRCDCGFWHIGHPRVGNR